VRRVGLPAAWPQLGRWHRRPLRDCCPRDQERSWEAARADNTGVVEARVTTHSRTADLRRVSPRHRNADVVFRFARDSPLEGTGFELPVRGRGQSGCRPFYAAESSGRVGAPSQFSDSTTPCIKAAWTRPPRPQSVPATHSAEVPSSRRADVEDSADLFHHLYQSPSSHCRPNATVPHECGTPFGIT
jgi:hypothetical protein